MAKLVLNPNSSHWREIPLTRSLVSIGRDPSNDVVLTDAMVSRRHAVIEFRSSQYFIRDCNSSNGSLVNGDRVSEKNLRDGDLLAIGTARFLFRDENVDASAKVVQHPSSPRQQCAACGADFRKGDSFCRTCGGAIAALPHRVVCTACGTAIPLPAKFCSACGGTLEGPLPIEEVSQAPRDGAGDGVNLAAALARTRDAKEPLPAPRELSLQVAPAPAVSVARPWLEPRPARLEPPRPRLRAALQEAELGPRFVAGVIDLGLVFLGEVLAIAPITYYWLVRHWPPEPQEPLFVPILLSVSGVLLTLALSAAYFLYFWAIRGTSPGKSVAGLGIETLDGRSPIGFSAAFLRLLGYVVSFALLGTGFLLIFFTHEGLHDRIAGTRVVQRERG
jgi:uncharacterized RDD family membrane protein YckC